MLIISPSAFSQKWKLTRYEVMVGVGAANYFGDIGGSATKENWGGLKDLDFLQTRPGIMAAARYKIKQDVAIKFSLSTIMISGSDVGSKNEFRGFSFTSYGLEHSLQIEYSFVSEDAKKRSFAYYNRRGMLNNFSRKSFYVFAGVGGLALLPFTKGPVNPDKTDIIDPTFNYSAVIPAGIGVKIIWSNYVSLGAEFGARYCFNDFLDGFRNPVYGRADLLGNDFYYFTSVNLIYRIKTSRKGYPILFNNFY